MLRKPAEHGTVSIHFVQEALQAVRGRVPEAAVLRRCGIPRSFLGEPLARVSPGQFGALWRETARHLDDELFALDSRPARPGCYAMLCQALVGCRDLHQALRRLCRYTELVLDDLRIALELAGDTATLRLHDARARATPFAHATCFMVAYGLACWLVAQRIPLLQCHLAGQAPSAQAQAEYRVMFCEDLVFAAAQGALVFPRAFLGRPVVQTQRSLGAFLRHAPDVFLVKYRNADSLAAQVRLRLRSLAPTDWPGLHAMAGDMGLTPSTLRRRLDSEGLSFQSIKNALRRDMAITLLGDAALPIEQLAQTLGFAEAPAFHRAFKKWTGMRPSDYRRRSQADLPA